MRSIVARLSRAPDRLALAGLFLLLAGFLFLHRSGGTDAAIAPRTVDPALIRGREAGLWQIGGEVAAVAARDRLVYAGQGARLVILDATDPDRPRPIGRTDLFALEGAIRDVAVDQGLAAVLAGSRLYAVDGARPDRPVVAGSIEVPAAAETVALAGSRAYLAAGRDGLRIVDLTRPDRPVRSGSLPEPASAVAVRGDRAYTISTARDQPVLRALDVSDPDRPAPLGSTALPFKDLDRHRLTAAGDLVYVLSGRSRTPGENSLTLIDVADPARPALVGSYSGSVGAIAATGRIAYLATAVGGGHDLRVVDASQPDRPVWTGSIAGLGDARSLAVVADRAYLAAGADGLRVLDLGPDPARPRLAGTYPAAGPVRDLALSGAWAYVLTEDAGHGRLLAIDRSDPAHPVIAGESPDLGNAAALALAGSDAYVLAGPPDRRSLRILSLADPVRPDLRATVPDLGAFDRVQATDRLLYLAGPGGLRVLDRSASDSPVPLGAFGSAAEDLAVAGDRAYLAAGSDGLLALDVSNPAVPIRIGSFAAPQPIRRVAAASGGSVAIIQGAALRLIDLADPARPAAIGTFPLDVEPAALRLAGPFAYLASGEAGLRIVDVSFPASPALVGAYAGSAVRALAVEGAQAAIGGDAGVIGFPFTGPPRPLLVKAAGRDATYRIDGQLKRSFAGPAAFTCRGYDWAGVGVVDPAVLDGLAEGPPIVTPGFCVPDRAPLRGTRRDLSLVMRDGLARPAESAEVIRCWGYDLTRTRTVDQDLLDGGIIPRGPALPAPAECLPHGAVIVDGADWYEMAGGVLRHVPDVETIRCRRLNDRIPRLDRSIAGLANRIGAPLRSGQGCAPPPDGTVVGANGSGTTQVIDGGLRRVIPSRAIARCLGLEGRTVRRLSDDELDDLPPGPPADCPP